MIFIDKTLLYSLESRYLIYTRTILKNDCEINSKRLHDDVLQRWRLFIVVMKHYQTYFIEILSVFMLRIRCVHSLVSLMSTSRMRRGSFGYMINHQYQQYYSTNVFNHYISKSSHALKLSTITSSILLENRTLPDNTVTSQALCDGITTQSPLTSAVLQISYDGSRFNGWSAGNDHQISLLLAKLSSKSIKNMPRDSLKGPSQDSEGRRKTRRRQPRNSYHSTYYRPTSNGQIRSVQGVLMTCLSKLFGNVDPRRIIVEGSSRTDKGVHARGMVAHIYCINEEAWNHIQRLSPSSLPGESMIHSSVPGKRMPHPMNMTDDTSFVPLPMPISKLTYSLNRMCPDDIRIVAIASSLSHHPPQLFPETKHIPFHATVSATSKTYQYQFSIGPIHDPTQWRTVWHIGDDRNWNENNVNIACNKILGTHDFTAFEGSPRSSSDKEKRADRSSNSTICTINNMSLNKIETGTWGNTVTYTVSITGDRFLYKMVRLLIGALVAVGKQQLSIELFEDMLIHVNNGFQVRNQQNLFMCAPAHGLLLDQVHYDHTTIDWQQAIS